MYVYIYVFKVFLKGHSYPITKYRDVKEDLAVVPAVDKANLRKDGD